MRSSTHHPQKRPPTTGGEVAHLPGIDGVLLIHGELSCFFSAVFFKTFKKQKSFKHKQRWHQQIDFWHDTSQIDV